MADKEQEKRINGSVRVGGRVFRAGEEDALAQVLRKRDAERLVRTGTLQGEGWESAAKGEKAVPAPGGTARRGQQRRANALAQAVKEAGQEGEEQEAQPQVPAAQEAPRNAARGNAVAREEGEEPATASATEEKDLPEFDNAGDLAGPYTAVKLGGGWYGITDANNEEALEGGDPYRVQGADSAEAVVQGLNKRDEAQVAGETTEAQEQEEGEGEGEGE